MGEIRQNDNQQRLSELERQRADGAGHVDAAGRRSVASAFCTLVPPGFPFVEGQATRVSAIKSNKLAEGAHARICVSMPSGVRGGSRVDRLERSLPEQTIHQRGCSRMIEHEPTVLGQGQPESAQV